MLDEWYIDIDYSLFRDYRIVKMADAQGNKRDGIFIPFLQNGIKWKAVTSPHPRQFLKPIPTHKDGDKISKLVPMVSMAFQREMINGGVLSPDDKYPCMEVGFIRKDRNKI